MNQFYIIDGLEPTIELKAVMQAIDCKEDNPVYDVMVEEFYDMHDEIHALVKPVGILGFGALSELSATGQYVKGSRVIYAVLSVGDEIKQRSTDYFDNGDYVRGMICDAMADCALFSLEGRMLEKLKEVCEEHNIGIVTRLEAPHDISMEVQKEAWEKLELKSRLGIDITSGYMLDPVKTSCQVFVLSENTDDFKVRHDCRNCPNVSCKFRNIPEIEIRIKKGNEAKKLTVKENESLMNALIREGYYINAVCGGKGRCGKCGVRVTEGTAPISEEDKKVFSPKELEDGWRLSCLLYPKENLTVEFGLNDESDFDVITDYGTGLNAAVESADSKYEIAIDIGTTTIAFQLLNNLEICHTFSMINRQRQYGADVVSRIKASVDGKAEELKKSIRNDLKNGILSLCQEYGIESAQVEKIVIACNTTMGHLLMGYDCEGLGKYPFTPVNIDFITGTAKDIVGIDIGAEVTLLPGISTYVGGDIVAGLYECGFDKTEDICLLIDLGTNGEMALGNRNKILVTSTAAGPAFEGGNISRGVGSIEGAICSVRLDGTKAQIKTIREKPPVGICGTGVVELTAELLKEELIDETGLFDDDYFEDGFPVAQAEDGEYIVFTQKDVREIQLAKAAIRAGAETLISRYGIEKKDISRIYIAGGFGYRLDTQKAVEIGMLPQELADRTQAVGNSSLGGAVKYLKERQSSNNSLHHIIDISEEISLGADKDFNDFYMESMMFE